MKLRDWVQIPWDTFRDEWCKAHHLYNKCFKYVKGKRRECKKGRCPVLKKWGVKE